MRWAWSAPRRPPAACRRADLCAPNVRDRSSGLRPPAGGSDLSAAAVSDADLRSLDDDRNGPLPFRELEHIVELRGIVDHVAVAHLVPLLLVRLTGGRGVGSGVLTENAHDVGHALLPVCPRYFPSVGCILALAHASINSAATFNSRREADTDAPAHEAGSQESSRQEIARGGKRGEPWRTRTSDPLIKSQLLYQLS